MKHKTMPLIGKWNVYSMAAGKFSARHTELGIAGAILVCIISVLIFWFLQQVEYQITSNFNCQQIKKKLFKTAPHFNPSHKVLCSQVRDLP